MQERSQEPPTNRQGDVCVPDAQARGEMSEEVKVAMKGVWDDFKMLSWGRTDTGAGRWSH